MVTRDEGVYDKPAKVDRQRNAIALPARHVILAILAPLNRIKDEVALVSDLDQDLVVTAFDVERR